ncbi:hypothetical protein AB0M02_04060 [Actinoplanes sp. NPDC051861]|uniref:hypothetical protein n=1 Tax=Actinoplanes sp. NPDC051861 TaxID=3155170 RepID=UPI00343F70EF
MKIVSRVAAVLVAIVGMVLVAPSPARAEREACSFVAGSQASSNRIWFCVIDYPVFQGTGNGYRVELSSRIAFDWNVTARTTTCRVIVRADLDKPGSDVWSSPAYAMNCNNVVAHQADDSIYEDSFFHGVFGTAATDINVIGCIDLYFNGSSTSGRQICKNSGWHKISGLPS